MMRRSQRLLLDAWVALLPSAQTAQAQDRREVTEPTLPDKPCAVLTAAAAAMPGSDTRRLQAAIDHCPAGSVSA